MKRMSLNSYNSNSNNNNKKSLRLPGNVRIGLVPRQLEEPLPYLQYVTTFNSCNSQTTSQSPHSSLFHRGDTRP